MDCREECVSISLHQHINFCSIVLLSCFINVQHRGDVAHCEYMNVGNVCISEVASKILLDDLPGFIQILFSGLRLSSKYPFVIGQLLKKTSDPEPFGANMQNVLRCPLIALIESDCSTWFDSLK